MRSLPDELVAERFVVFADGAPLVHPAARGVTFLPDDALHRLADDVLIGAEVLVGPDAALRQHAVSVFNVLGIAGRNSQQ